MRMRSTRELWDNSFFAETWFTMSMGYLRRLHDLIEQHAPWLKMSCTEFSYGSEKDVVDAVLTLDALAIYAREGVDLATRWTAPTLGSITSYAYTLLNNYDQMVDRSQACLTSILHPQSRCWAHMPSVTRTAKRRQFFSSAGSMKVHW